MAGAVFASRSHFPQDACRFLQSEQSMLRDPLAAVAPMPCASERVHGAKVELLPQPALHAVQMRTAPRRLWLAAAIAHHGPPPGAAFVASTKLFPSYRRV